MKELAYRIAAVSRLKNGNKPILFENNLFILDIEIRPFEDRPDILLWSAS